MKTRKAAPTSASLPPSAASSTAADESGFDEVDEETPGTVTKRKLVVDITKELEKEALDTGKRALTQLEVFAVIQKTLDHISRAMSDGYKVELRNFGVFEVKVRKARVGRNPNRPETDVPIPERPVVKFKAGKDMRLDVVKLSPLKKGAPAP